MKRVKQLIVITLCLLLNITTVYASTKTIERTKE